VTNQSALRTAWTDGLAAGKQPDKDDLLDHMVTVHRDNAGFTEDCARTCRDSQGRSSYEWLAEVVVPGQHGTVLDLACGSGHLLELLHARHPQLALIGVDMSGEELELARQRLPDKAVRLIEAEAQSLSALADDSVDAVLCHWALTLMDPVEPVLAELRRILTSGGCFAALVDGPADTAPGYAEVNDLIYGHVQADLPEYGSVDLGDPRVRDGASLSELVKDALPGATVNVESSVVAMEGRPDVVAEAAAGFFYAAFVLAETSRARMLDELAALLPKGTAPGSARFAMPVNRLLVTL